MSKKVRTLLRVSSRQQLHDDDIPIQRAEALQYIRMHPDWSFDREYMEKAISAYKNHVTEREVLQQILSDARAHQFDILLAYMSDRIGRQEEYSFYVAALNQLGIEVWTVRDGQLKTEEHTDKLINYIRFWQNEGESRKTSMRVRDSRKEMVRAGRFAGGRAPFGYQLVLSGEISNHGRLLKKLEIVEKDAKTVRKIYSLAAYRGLGYEKIAGVLNQEGIPPILADRWKAVTIAGILKNPIYMGYYSIGRGKERIYSEKQDPGLVIISPEVWKKAEQIRTSRSSGQKGPYPVSTTGKLALTGLVSCGYCGKRLRNGSYCNRWKVKKTGEEKAVFAGRYCCPGRCRERSCYAQNYLEGVVFEAVEACLEMLEPADLTEELCRRQEIQRKKTEKELSRIRKRVLNIRQDVKTLEEEIPEALRGDACFSPEQLSELLGEKRKEEQVLCGQLHELQGKLEELLLRQETDRQSDRWKPSWKEVFQKADIPARKMLLSAMIERIEVKARTVRIIFRISREDLIPERVYFAVPEQRV